MNLDELLRKGLGEIGGIAFGSTPSQARVRDLETILSIVRKINTSLRVPELLDLVVDEAIRITRAERGFVMLADSHGQLKFVVGRTATGLPIDAQKFQVSSSVLEDVFTTGESVCIENALNDERFERRKSVLNLELQTILCSALRTQDDTLGVIYVDSKFIQPVDSADILYLFEILAGQAATAIKNAQLYEELKTAYDNLKRANEQIIKFERMALKGEIAAELSHELKNIVNIVVLNLHVLRKRFEQFTPDQIRTIVDATCDNGTRLIKFSENLLSRSRAGAMLQPGDLREVMEQFVDFIRMLPKFKGTTIKASLDDGLPPVKLDPDQIQQVLLNMVNNAVEACPGAVITLATKYDPAERTVRLSIKDNGPGIDPSIMDRIFNERVTTKANGHGYGLRICRHILEAHGGTVQVKSHPNAGTEFILTFPVIEPGHPEQSA